MEGYIGVSDSPDLWEREIELPNGLVRTAGDIYDGLHLEAFVNQVLDAEGFIDPEEVSC